MLYIRFQTVNRGKRETTLDEIWFMTKKRSSETVSVEMDIL